MRWLIFVVLGCSRPVRYEPLSNHVEYVEPVDAGQRPWWDYCQRIGRLEKCITWSTSNGGVMICGC